MSDKKGFGCCGIGCGVLVIIALIVIGAGIWAYTYVSRRIYIKQPAKIETLARDICDYSLPGDFTPTFGGTLFSFRGALFEDSSTTSNALAYILEIPETNTATSVSQSINMQITQRGNVANASHMITHMLTITNGFGISTQSFKKVFYTDTGEQTVIYYGAYNFSNRTIMASLFSVASTNDLRGPDFLRSIGPPKK